jgi:hypothetical protein
VAGQPDAVGRELDQGKTNHQGTGGERILASRDDYERENNVKTEMEEKVFFDWIRKTWLEREFEEFVSRDELVEILFETCGTVTDELMEASARGGIALALDCFAKTGPETLLVWAEIMDTIETRDFYAGSEVEDGDFYWRYQVVREGVVGYVAKGDLYLAFRSHARCSSGQANIGTCSLSGNAQNE